MDNYNNVILQPMDSSDFQTLSSFDIKLVLHYDKFIEGEPTQAYKVDNLPDYVTNPFYILEFNHTVLGEPCKVYTTVGASHQNKHYYSTSEGNELEYGNELLVYSRETNRDIADFLVYLVLYLFEHQTSFDLNHGMKFGDDRSIVKGSSLTTAFFTTPFLEKAFKDFSALSFENGVHTHILWVLPLYEMEYEFLKQHGARKLFQLFIDQSTDVADTCRAPVNLAI